LRRIFGPKGDGVSGGWRKFQNEQIHNSCSSPGVRKIKSMRFRWTGYVQRSALEI
jgi:hypothetical protein